MDTQTGPDTAWQRLRPARTAFVVAAVLLLAAGGWLVVRAAVPSDGAPVIADPGFRAGLTVNPSATTGGGLRADDVVVAVNGARLDHWLTTSAARPAVRNGARLTYGVMRHGHRQDVAVTLARDGVESSQLRRGPGGVLLAALAVLALGAFAAYRRPEQPPARALLVFGAGLVAYTIFSTFGYDTADVVGARLVFIAGFVGATTGLAVWAAAAAHLAFTFPTAPAVLQRRPRIVAAAYGGAVLLVAGVPAAVLVVGQATLARLDQLDTIGGGVLTALAVLTLAGLVRTFIRARQAPASRSQGLIVAIGFAVTIAVLAVGNLVAGDRSWPAWLVATAFVPLPAGVATAVVRGEFLDIRAVVNRALVYGLLTALLLALYALAVTVVGALVGDTGLASTAIAAGMVAVAFAPLRAKLQRRVDHLLYGERGDPARVLGTLGRTLEAAAPPDRVLPTIAETIAAALNVPYVALWTGTDHTARLACERGEPVAEPFAVALVHQGVPVGELVVGSRRGERTLSATDRAVLADVARQIAPAVSAAALLTDLTASRRRVAVAHEEERARLRHDLHDRLGPHLVGLSLQLDSLQRGVDGETAEAIARAHGEATRALEEVRRISRGLRPAELDQLGLVEAIDAAAARLTVSDDDGIWHVTIEAATQLASIPPDVEAAAYQIALEALSNAYRHSGGHGARVRLGVDASGAQLVIDITDDGCGIDPTAPRGVGLRSMHERAAAVGGYLTVDGHAGGGTGVRATFPLARPADARPRPAP